jgi:hypothetical protein
MKPTAEILTDFERCTRIPVWSRNWEKGNIKPEKILESGIRSALLDSKEPDPGVYAGECMVEISSRRTIDTDVHDVYSQAIHYAALGDVIVSAIRKPTDEAWKLPDPITLRGGQEWHSGAFLDPSETHLRRVALVSGWNNDRHYAECRSWSALGEICAYGLPMQLIVCVLGQSKNGRRHSYWSHGLTHPVNKKLRFRKKENISSGFKDTWREIWREDHDEIDTKTWLQAMLDDGVLRDVLIRVDIPCPEKLERQRVSDLASRKLERLDKIKTLPDQSLSVCDWPVPCPHRRHCHANEEPSGRYGFVPVDSLNLR